MLRLLLLGNTMMIFNGGCAAPRPSPNATSISSLSAAAPPGTSAPSAPPSDTSYSGVPVFVDSWSGVTAGAAAGYCLAKHPYQSNSRTPYTSEGYEKVGVPGVVGAVRRNFMKRRATTTTDQGERQTCDMACREFGKDYEPTYQGRALHQDLGDGKLITSGIGDMAASAYPDHDFYLGRPTVAGMGSRANTYHESDVAQADYCCCHVTTPQP